MRRKKPRKALSDSPKITPKMEIFVREYLVDHNGARAARAAGYAEKTANVQAATLLANEKIQGLIQVELGKRKERLELDGDDVLRRLDTIGDVDIAKCFDEKGQFLSVHEIPEEIRKCIRSIKVFEEWSGAGRDRTKIGEVREVTFWDKIKANELIGKNLELWTDKIKVTGSELADKLKAARERAKGK